MLSLPVRNTFIDFCTAEPQPGRCSSAPPNLGTQVCTRRKFRRRKKHLTKDPDEGVLNEFAAKAISEQWARMARRLCEQIRQKATHEIDQPRLRVTLPRFLFHDWAFYSFIDRNASEFIRGLFQARILQEKSDDCIQLCCSRRQLQKNRKPSLRTLIKNAEKILDVQERGRFSVVVNFDVIVHLVHAPELNMSTIVSQIKGLLHVTGNAIVMHRNAILTEGSLRDNGIEPGNQLAIFLP